MDKEIVLAINPCIDGLNYHDPACAIFVNGELVFAAEDERFTKIKSSPGVFPNQAIAIGLSTIGAEMKDVNVIAIPYNPDLNCGRQLILDKWGKNNTEAKFITSSTLAHSASIISKLGYEAKKARTLFFDHHLCHAASSYL